MRSKDDCRPSSPPHASSNLSSRGGESQKLRHSGLRKVRMRNPRNLAHIEATQAAESGSRETHHSTSPKIFHFDALLTSSGGYLWLAETSRSELWIR